MRRVVGVVALTALALALRLSVAAAELSFTSGPYSGPQIMLRLFGETSDQTASFDAARGDESSESPLRELALGVVRPAPAPGFLSGTGSVEVARADGGRALFAAGDPYTGAASAAALAQDGARFSPSAALPGQYVPTIAQPALLTAAYKPVAPAASISPDPGTLAFGETPGESLTVPVAATAAHLQFDEHADLSLPERSSRRTTTLPMPAQISAFVPVSAT